MWLRLVVAVAVAAAQPVTAQPIQLRVYSEFQRPDPFGHIVSVDRARRPREILSPAVARNGYASFHVAVTVPEGTPYWLFAAQNPEDTLRLTLYRERFVRRGEEWIPDQLVRVETPFDSRTIPSEERIRGQTTTAFWLDAWVPAQAPVGRIRLEVQLNVGDHWVIAPMEVRIRPARIPGHAESEARLPLVEASADRSALQPLRAYLCGAAESGATEAMTVRSLVRRNAWQDVALARALEATLGAEAVRQGILGAIGASDLGAWCRAPGGPPELGAEWYLRVRDFLLRAAP